MGFLVGLVIGIIVGIFYTALVQSCDYREAHAAGSRYAKEVICNYLVDHIGEENTQLIEDIRKMLFV